MHKHLFVLGTKEEKEIQYKQVVSSEDDIQSDGLGSDTHHVESGN